MVNCLVVIGSRSINPTDEIIFAATQAKIQTIRLFVYQTNINKLFADFANQFYFDSGEYDDWVSACVPPSLSLFPSLSQLQNDISEMCAKCSWLSNTFNTTDAPMIYITFDWCGWRCTVHDVHSAPQFIGTILSVDKKTSHELWLMRHVERWRKSTQFLPTATKFRNKANTEKNYRRQLKTIAKWFIVLNISICIYTIALFIIES